MLYTQSQRNSSVWCERSEGMRRTRTKTSMMITGMCANMNLCVSTKLYLPSPFIPPYIQTERVCVCLFFFFFPVIHLSHLLFPFQYDDFDHIAHSRLIIHGHTCIRNNFSTNNRTSYLNSNEIRHSTVILVCERLAIRECLNTQKPKTIRKM